MIRLFQEGHNIFSKLTPQEYKQVLGNIKHCILATDLAVYFRRRNETFEKMSSNTLEWTTEDKDRHSDR